MASRATNREASTHSIAVVVPVYAGETTLEAVVGELKSLTDPWRTPDGHTAQVVEIVLVHDHGRDRSDQVMRALAAANARVRVVWLSRNFGQHAATIAGISATSAEWVVTVDEDGQHDPQFIGPMLDTALASQAPVVYAKPTNSAPHSVGRNLSSRGAKWVLSLLASEVHPQDFHSFRLMLGELARGVAGYAGEGVYLDVALSWVAPKPATCPVELRQEGARKSGYSTRTLIRHFWRMILTTGTRGLRLVSAMGAVLGIAGVVFAIVIVVQQLAGADVPAGWPSTMSVLLIATGAIMVSLGIIAEYIGVNVNMSLGKPSYLVISDPATSPLARDKRAQND